MTMIQRIKKSTLMLSMGIGAALLFMNSCQSGMTSFKETPSGLKYKIIDDKSGDVAKVGDYLKIDNRVTVHDSVLFDAHEDGPGYRWMPLQKPNGQPYDVMEGLALLSKGDSAEFVVPADSVMKNPMQRPPFVEKGDKIHFYVRVLDIQDEANYKSSLEKEKQLQNTADEKIIKAYLDSTHQQATRTENGVYVVKQKEGSGSLPQDGQEVTVMYTGKLLNGEVFDSNEDSAFHHTQPLVFPLGQNRMIPGMEEGVKMLKKGAEATLYVPSGLAYGTGGRPPLIKPNTVLVFDVKVRDVSGEANASSPQGGGSK